MDDPLGVDWTGRKNFTVIRGIQQKTHKLCISTILHIINMFLSATADIPYHRLMYRRWCLLTMAVVLLAQPGLAAAQGRAGCLNPDEVTAESIVRTGVDLREILKSCAKQGFATTTGTASEALARFRKFDSDYGDKIQGELEIRRLALERNYPDRKAVERQMDGAIISVYQGRQMSDGECLGAIQVMSQIEVEGWKAFERHVEITRRYIEPNVIPCQAPR
jgi:hypothetical protein